MPDRSYVAIFPLWLGTTRGQGIINVTSDKGYSLHTTIDMSNGINCSKVSKTKSIINVDSMQLPIQNHIEGCG